MSLWLYANIRGIGAARELDRQCKESRPFQWLCGGVTVNYHLLSDFRVGHAGALDGLFTATIASLVDKGLVKVRRVSQPVRLRSGGVRIRAGAGASSFRRGATLDHTLSGVEGLLADAEKRVEDLGRQVADPEFAAAVGSRKAAAATRAAKDRAERLKQAIAQMPQLPVRLRSG